MRTKYRRDGNPISGDRVLKVDHAGEHGAVNIYAAQIFVARFTAPTLVRELIEFKSHEEKHRSLFSADLERRGLRRCRSYLLWQAAVGKCGQSSFLQMENNIGK